MKEIRVIISGGGTGGHIFPAIAIGKALLEKKPESRLLFVGAYGKMEMHAVPKAGFIIKGLWISGFQRKLTFRNLLFPIKLLVSLAQAFWIVRRFRPQVVVGVGGFASGPTLRVANWLNIPTLIQEQNSYAGITNRLLAKKAGAICVAYPDMHRYFPAAKIRLTGNPIRKDLENLNFDRRHAYDYFNLEAGKPVIFVFGGSLGAKTINEAMAGATTLWAENADIQVLWQVGKLYYERYKDCEAAKLQNVHLSAFVDRMDLAYGVADVVVCRAGALTIAEICACGKAAVLIPSPNVAEDHQTKNALALTQRDAAVMIADKDAKERLAPMALELLHNSGRRQELAMAAKKMALPGAAQKIVEEVYKLTD